MSREWKYDRIVLEYNEWPRYSIAGRAVMLTKEGSIALPMAAHGFNVP